MADASVLCVQTDLDDYVADSHVFGSVSGCATPGVMAKL
jgi:hypothetical protein